MASLTKADLVARVRRLLGDYSTNGKSTMTGDGSTVFMPLRDRFIDPATLVVTLTDEDGTTTLLATDYTLDVDYPSLTLDTAPASEVVVDANYRYRFFSDDDIDIWLDHSLSALAKWFYVRDTLDIALDGSRVYAIDDTTDEPPLRVQTVSWSPDSGESNYQRLQQGDWHIDRDTLEVAALCLHTDPSCGTVRLRYTRRPLPFDETLVDLADLGVPERAAQCYVLNTAFMLLEEAIIPRMRADHAVATQGNGAVRVSYLMQHASHIKALLDIELERTKLPRHLTVGV